MPSARNVCPTLLSLLQDFYQRLPGQSAPDAKVIEPAEIPEPYAGLLVHNSDMTSTLEKFHGERLNLCVLESVLAADRLSRHIILRGAQSNLPLEYGAIQINLGVLSEDVQRKVMECRAPLGGILNEHGVVFGSCPGAFFTVRPTKLMMQVLSLDGSQWLYGRCNCLSDRSGRAIAEVIEILPPNGRAST